jgi:hypothetical protein
LNKEVKKDEIELSKEREKFIQEIKNIKRENLFPKPEKLSLWTRLRRVMGF